MVVYIMLDFYNKTVISGIPVTRLGFNSANNVSRIQLIPDNPGI